MLGSPQRRGPHESYWRWDWESAPDMGALAVALRAWLSVTVPSPAIVGQGEHGGRRPHRLGRQVGTPLRPERAQRVRRCCSYVHAPSDAAHAGGMSGHG